MDNKAGFGHKLRMSKAEYDPLAWQSMSELLDAQVSAKPRPRFWLLTLVFLVSLGIGGVAFFDGMNRDSGESTIEENTTHQPTGDERTPEETSQGLADDISDADTDQIESKEEDNKTIDSEPDTDAKPTEAIRTSVQTPKRNLRTAPVLSNRIEDLSTISPKVDQELKEVTVVASNENSLLIDLKKNYAIAPITHIGILDPLARNDTTFSGVASLSYSTERQPKKFDNWDWFLIAGNTQGIEPRLDAGGQLGRGEVDNVFYAGLGVKLTDKTMFQAYFGKFYNKMGFSYIFGEGRAKWGPDLSLLIVRDVLGPSFGVNFYYHLSNNSRLFLKASRTNYRFFGENESMINEIGFGTQFRLPSIWNFDRQTERRFRRRSPLAPGNLDSKENELWSPFLGFYNDLGHYFGYGGNIGLSVGTYFEKNTFGQLGFRIPLSGYRHQTNFDYVDRFGVEFNVNQLFGKYRWFALVQAGALITPSSNNLWSTDRNKGTLQPTVGVGALFKANNLLRLYILGNLRDPHTDFEFVSRFSIQTGLQIKL